MLTANDPSLKSWLGIPENSDFPIQNLPFGIFKTEYLSAGAAVAIGDYVLDLVFLYEHGFLDGLGLPPGIFNQQYLNDFLALGKKTTTATRERISELLRNDNKELQGNMEARELALIPMNEVEMLLPVRIPNYTDFYSSIEHATNVGSMFRDPSNALLPNWKHLPVAYHGRASSIVVSGTPIHRPNGQIKTEESSGPIFTPTKKLDFELEIAFITCTNTELGSPVDVNDAANHIFGFVLLNDWSARDLQQWEYAPLGPFLGKNFGSTISPWIVTMDALKPFSVEGPVQTPAVLKYLENHGTNNFDVNLEVSMQPHGSSRPTTVCQTNSKYLYWNVAQQLAHHTSNGCNINAGDLYGSGTISGPEEKSYGSLLELTWNGKKSITLDHGADRKFIEDGDIVTLRGYAQRDGIRIGFGECSGKILQARTLRSSITK